MVGGGGGIHSSSGDLYRILTWGYPHHAHINVSPPVIVSVVLKPKIGLGDMKPQPHWTILASKWGRKPWVCSSSVLIFQGSLCRLVNIPKWSQNFWTLTCKRADSLLWISTFIFFLESSQQCCKLWRAGVFILLLQRKKNKAPAIIQLGFWRQSRTHNAFYTSTNIQIQMLAW